MPKERWGAPEWSYGGTLHPRPPFSSSTPYTFPEGAVAAAPAGVWCWRGKCHPHFLPLKMCSWLLDNNKKSDISLSSSETGYCSFAIIATMTSLLLEPEQGRCKVRGGSGGEGAVLLRAQYWLVIPLVHTV